MHPNRADRWTVIGLIAATLVFGLPILWHPGHVEPISDYGFLSPPPPWRLEFYFFAAADYASIMRYGQFPMWSPWMGGGYPVMGFPQDYGMLSPRLPLILGLGIVPGFKVDFLITQALGAIGLYLLLRRVGGVGVLGSLTAASCFAFGGLGTLWVHGRMDLIRHGYTPLILYLLYTSRRHRWRLLGATVLLVFMLTDQNYTPLYAGWFVVLAAAARLFEGRTGCGQPPQGASFCGPVAPQGGGHEGATGGLQPVGVGPNWRVLGCFAACAVWAGLILTGKWVGLVPLLRRHTRGVFHGDLEYGPAAATVAWVSVLAILALLPRLRRPSRADWRRDVALRLGVLALVCAVLFVSPPPESTEAGWDRRKADLQRRLEGLVAYGTIGDPMAGMFDWPLKQVWGSRFSVPVGHVGVVLAAVALVGAPRRLWRWWAVAGLFALMTLGPVLRVDLARAVWNLPFLSLCRKPLEHLFIYRTLCLAALAGYGLDVVLRRLPGRARLPAGAAVLGANVLLLAHLMAPRLAYTSLEPLPPGPDPGDFHTIQWAPSPAQHLWVLADVGLRDFNGDLYNPEYVAVRPKSVLDERGRLRPNPHYRGRVHFKFHPENRARWTRFSPNRWTFRVHVAKPDTMLINQVYDPRWRTDEGRLMRSSRLMAVRLDQTGTYDVHLRFLPVAFFIGAGVGGLALLAGLLLLWRLSRRARQAERGQNP